MWKKFVKKNQQEYQNMGCPIFAKLPTPSVRFCLILPHPVLVFHVINEKFCPSPLPVRLLPPFCLIDTTTTEYKGACLGKSCGYAPWVHYGNLLSNLSTNIVQQLFLTVSCVIVTKNVYVVQNIQIPICTLMVTGQ
jgi:hypothetical protein